MTGTEIAVLDDPTKLLELMRRVAGEFTNHYNTFHEILAFAAGNNTAGMEPSPQVLMCQHLKANAELVLGLPGHLGQYGLRMLTADERQALLYWAGIANDRLADEQPDGTFRATYALQVLCRQDGVAGTLFDRIVERLEAEEAGRMLARRHIAALDLILRDRSLAEASAARVARHLEASGVRFQPKPGIGLMEWMKPEVIEAALTLYIRAVPVTTLEGQEISGAELLYALGFRANLSDSPAIGSGPRAITE